MARLQTFIGTLKTNSYLNSFTEEVQKLIYKWIDGESNNGFGSKEVGDIIKSIYEKYKPVFNLKDWDWEFNGT